MIESSLTNVNFQSRTGQDRMPSSTEQGRTGIFFLNDIFSCQGRLVCEQDTGQDRSRKSVLWTALLYTLRYLPSRTKMQCVTYRALLQKSQLLIGSYTFHFIYRIGHFIVCVDTIITLCLDHLENLIRLNKISNYWTI